MLGARNCREQGESYYKAAREEVETVSILTAMIVNRYINGAHDKGSAYKAKDPGLIPGSRRSKILWRKEWLPNPVFLPEEFHGQRSLAGYSPWDRKESDTTEQLSALIK